MQNSAYGFDKYVKTARPHDRRMRAYAVDPRGAFVPAQATNGAMADTRGAIRLGHGPGPAAGVASDSRQDDALREGPVLMKLSTSTRVFGTGLLMAMVALLHARDVRHRHDVHRSGLRSPSAYRSIEVWMWLSQAASVCLSRSLSASASASDQRRPRLAG